MEKVCKYIYKFDKKEKCFPIKKNGTHEKYDTASNVSLGRLQHTNKLDAFSWHCEKMLQSILWQHIE